MKGLKRVEQGCNKINILLQQWELQRLEIFFLFVAIVFIPLHFLVQIDVPILWRRSSICQFRSICGRRTFLSAPISNIL